MNLDTNTLVIAGILATTLIAEMRLLRRYMSVLIAASTERARRRDRRRQHESAPPPLTLHRRSSVPAESWEDEDTDIHVLMGLERESQRARRKTGRQRSPGERSPRPGTHHD